MMDGSENAWPGSGSAVSSSAVLGHRRFFPFANHRHRTLNTQQAFTLIEVLLVVMIILITTAIAIPSFVQSFRGAKLRTSARSVVMMHRLARAKAVLGQKRIAVIFDSKKQELEMVSINEGSQADDENRFLDSRNQRTTAELDEADKPTEKTEAVPPVQTEEIRRLAEGVSINAFETQSGQHSIDGIFWVEYYPNGMTQKYAMKLRDQQGKECTVTVDPLSGRVQTEYE